MTGRSVGSDASPLSCFLFRPRKRLEKRRKRSHTNVSNTLVARPSTPPAQTPQRLFQGAAAGTHATPAPNRAHSGLHGETRGVLDGGWYHYPRSVLCGSETLRGRVSERQTLPLLGLGRMYSQRTQRACGTAMRSCASLSRGVAAPLGCVIFLLLSKLWLVHPALRAFCACEAGVVSLPSACFACCRNAGRPLVKMVYLPFSGVAEHHSLRGHFFC